MVSKPKITKENGCVEKQNVGCLVENKPMYLRPRPKPAGLGPKHTKENLCG